MIIASNSALLIVVPSPRVGEGSSTGGHGRVWVRGLPPRIAEAVSLAETNPSPAIASSMRWRPLPQGERRELAAAGCFNSRASRSQASLQIACQTHALDLGDRRIGGLQLRLIGR